MSAWQLGGSRYTQTALPTTESRTFIVNMVWTAISYSIAPGNESGSISVKTSLLQYNKASSDRVGIETLSIKSAPGYYYWVQKDYKYIVLKLTVLYPWLCWKFWYFQAGPGLILEDYKPLYTVVVVTPIEPLLQRTVHYFYSPPLLLPFAKLMMYFQTTMVSTI